LSKFSLLDHEFIPRHEIIDEDEIKSVLKEYNMVGNSYLKSR